jgi:6-phosphogluconate dehydrogenase
MKLGMVGLGRMGHGMTERLRGDGHEVMTYDPDPQKGSTADSLAELVRQLEPPRVVWMMIPAGEITEATTLELLGLLQADDVLVDGGNSNHRDSKRRHELAKERGIHFVDVGVSGGVWGLRVGFALMAGGDEEPVSRLEELFRSLAPEQGWAHVGPSGAGHFVKMVHNGIEYGLMQAYAEGFELMHHADYPLDLTEIAGIWRHGSVVRSWLLDLLYEAFREHGSALEEIAGYVDDSGEGRWTINEAIDAAVPVQVIASSLFARFASRRDINFAAKVAAALRNQFGGHAVRAAERRGAGPETDPR